MRLVLDFRKLNERTIADRYPMPNISMILGSLGSARNFTTLDLKLVKSKRRLGNKFSPLSEEKTVEADMVVGYPNFIKHYNKSKINLLTSIPLLFILILTSAHVTDYSQAKYIPIIDRRILIRIRETLSESLRV
ncbi:uncharacterized protein LOC128263913 [Drosophila gunungcola]|uniref:uncharacterized protein LOC128263913 n=1 Tax=Drosophila gunungcola TaxID=103775 RepID=UPI0022E8C743|nr:uncharacterized protein LOC128263913 [Drosophila gunungcola]